MYRPGKSITVYAQAVVIETLTTLTDLKEERTRKEEKGYIKEKTIQQYFKISFPVESAVKMVSTHLI